MEDRLSRLERTVRDLEQTLRLVEHRLAVVEGRAASPAPVAATVTAAVAAQAGTAVVEPMPPAVVEAASTATGAAPAAMPRVDVVSWLSHIGRTFVALGGAYLLRALTDSGALPAGNGLAIGLAYGLLWLVLADRAGAAGRRLSAAFDGLVAAMITLPLVWEAAVRFNFIGPEATAVALAFVTGAAFAVAVRQRLQSLAWIVTAAVLPEAIGLIIKTTAVVPFAFFLIALGLVALWLGYTRHWIYLRWPTAFFADLAVFALVVRVASGSWGESAGRVVTAQLVLLTGYILSIAIRTLVRARDVVPFEVVQAFAVLGIGFGGAVYVAHATGSGVLALAAINLAFGAACYAVAFVFVAQRQGLRRNFYFYTSLALVLVLLSTNLLLPPSPLAIAWVTLALVATVVARQLGRSALNLHASVYVIGAAGVSGLLTAAAFALIGPVDEAWLPFTGAALVVLATGLACWAMPLARVPDWGAYARIPRLLLAIALVWCAGGWIVGTLTPVLCGVPGGTIDPGALATVRTSVLAIAALGLAWIGRTDRFRESGWLLYPVLVGGGIKLLFEDFPRSRPSTLFVALALYGIALIAAPRISHRAA